MIYIEYICHPCAIVSPFNIAITQSHSGNIFGWIFWGSRRDVISSFCPSGVVACNCASSSKTSLQLRLYGRFPVSHSNSKKHTSWLLILVEETWKVRKPTAGFEVHIKFGTASRISSLCWPLMSPASAPSFSFQVQKAGPGETARWSIAQNGPSGKMLRPSG